MNERIVHIHYQLDNGLHNLLWWLFNMPRKHAGENCFVWRSMRCQILQTFNHVSIKKACIHVLFLSRNEALSGITSDPGSNRLCWLHPSPSFTTQFCCRQFVLCSFQRTLIEYTQLLHQNHFQKSRVEVSSSERSVIPRPLSLSTNYLGDTMPAHCNSKQHTRLKRTFAVL